MAATLRDNGLHGYMAAFETEALTTHPLDYQLAGGPVLFWSRDVLRESTDWLDDHGYEVVTLSVAMWRDKERMHDDFSQALNFPAHYGRNFDALNDCLSDAVIGEYRSSPSDVGLVVVLTGFDEFSRSARESAHVVLNILHRQATYAMLFGHRVLLLIQSDDRNLAIEPVDAVPSRWNNIEFRDSMRRR